MSIYRYIYLQASNPKKGYKTTPEEPNRKPWEGPPLSDLHNVVRAEDSDDHSHRVIGLRVWGLGLRVTMDSQSHRRRKS